MTVSITGDKLIGHDRSGWSRQLFSAILISLRRWHRFQYSPLSYFTRAMIWLPHYFTNKISQNYAIRLGKHSFRRFSAITLNALLLILSALLTRHQLSLQLCRISLRSIFHHSHFDRCFVLTRLSESAGLDDGFDRCHVILLHYQRLYAGTRLTPSDCFHSAHLLALVGIRHARITNSSSSIILVSKY